jgi:hypothetical protein
MTGYPPLKASPFHRINIVQLDGLIPIPKQPYPRFQALGHIGDTFYAGMRSIYFGLPRVSAQTAQANEQKRVWIK